MRTTVPGIVLPVAALALVATGCTTGAGDAADKGQTASEVCGGFAKDPGVASALEALAVPGSDASKDLVTAYATGRLATSSDLHAALYFTCRMPAPAHAIVLDAELERADENEADHPGIRDEQITLANAAARQVAAELGCGETGLVGGVPAKARP
ncbi:hypothetical protein ACFTWS_19130 [Streptomyces sp. NPDC057027]|uniref:hypothetical protein n=1 Tax=Streptomyces sp. NPDC057027 TaxID=3346004 RepID=UPI00363CE61B